MLELNEGVVKQAIKDINAEDEKNRRADALKKHQIYKDGGREFLLEQVRREFNEDAVKEMRLAPVNVMKKIINMKSQVYKKSPVRTVELEKDQALVDYYVENMALNRVMQKANRYYNLFSNTQIYVRVDEKGRLAAECVTPYHYGIVPNPYNLELEEAVIFSAFPQKDEIAPYEDVNAPTGVQSYDRNKGVSTGSELVKSDQHNITDRNVQYVFWSKDKHVITDYAGTPISVIDEDWSNPLGIIPSVHLTKDRDNETYSTVGQDLAQLTLAIQLGWSDLITIAKHQGYSLLVLTGPEAPEKITMGVNRAIWMKTDSEGNAPSIDYVTASSPLSEYKELLVELLAMLLSSNDLNPQAVGGTFAANQATSGFHALIQNADTLDAIEADRPVMKDAELDLWEIIKTYHNWMHDGGLLDGEAKSLGKFSEDLKVNITYPDIRPLQSEQENITNVKGLLSDGLISRRQGLKKLNPDMDDDQVDALLEEIQEERAQVMSRFGGLNANRSAEV